VESYTSYDFFDSGLRADLLFEIEVPQVIDETSMSRQDIAQENSQASEIRYRRLFESAREGILIRP